MAEHLQLRSITEMIQNLESLLGAALANKEMDLVISFAGALDALQRVRIMLEYKSQQRNTDDP